MDELDLLKKDWKKQEATLPRLSYQDIYKMLWKKSSSIVKWIFIISILELLFWGVLNVFLADGQFWKQMELIHLKEFTIALYVVSYLVTFYFIYRFYRNYQKISATDDATTLMTNILRTRKTVKCYIAFIIISTVISSLVYTGFMVYYHINQTVVDDPSKYTFTTTQWLIFAGGMLFVMAIFIGLIWLFYRVVYGILLKNLYRNYRELKKLEV
ncbi:hypothetical protein ACW6QP_06295 [Salegentibacter sp. HM20]